MSITPVMLTEFCYLAGLLNQMAGRVFNFILSEMYNICIGN